MPNRIASGWLARAGLFAAVSLAAGCGAETVYEVADDTYLSQVPSTEQFDRDVAGALPGGLTQLRAEGVDRIEVEIKAIK